MTKFSFEVPIHHLWDFHPFQDFLFILPQLLIDEEYRKYVLKVKRMGTHTIWLDNGFNETLQAADAWSLLGPNTLLSPQRVIVPDRLDETPAQVRESYLQMLYLGFPKERLTVVCSTLKTVKAMRDEFDCPIAIPYRRRSNFDPGWDDLTQTHFLGLNSIDEVRKFKPTTCDTSMPIKLAIKGWDIGIWLSKGCPHIHTSELGEYGMDFFNIRMTKHQIHLAKENIANLKIRS